MDDAAPLRCHDKRRPAESDGWGRNARYDSASRPSPCPPNADRPRLAARASFATTRSATAPSRRAIGTVPLLYPGGRLWNMAQGASQCGSDSGNCRRTVSKHRLQFVSRGAPRVSDDRLGERPVGRLKLAVVTGALQYRHAALPREIGELLEHPGLADPRFTKEHRHRTTPARCDVKLRRQPFHRRGPPDERRPAQKRGQVAGLVSDLTDRHRLGKPFQVQHPHVAKVESVARAEQIGYQPAAKNLSRAG